jgi:2-haloacid dehalogenase
MLVAAHEIDLDAASEAGLRTAYVHRPDEWGPEAEGDEMPDESTYDLVVDDVLDLADRLGAEPIA